MAQSSIKAHKYKVSLFCLGIQSQNVDAVSPLATQAHNFKNVLISTEAFITRELLIVKVRSEFSSWEV